MPALILKPGREKSLLRRHPWIFSGAIQSMDEEPASGATVDLLSSDKHFLARAAYSPTSQIRARAWTFEDEVVDREFFRRRIRSAVELRRKSNVEGQSNAYRLIYAESDYIPGLIVDRYNDVLVLQSLTAGAEYWKETLADLLLEETGLTTIYERSDADVRGLEGLEPKIGLLRGTLSTFHFPIIEHNLQFNLNIASGHKTGFYLDQRKNRLRVRELAKDKDVLDCFCYTGGFTVNALAGGAKSVISVDSSSDALDLCKENIARNKLPLDSHTSLEGDVFQLLRKFRDERHSFDMIILDPPKFAPTSAHAEKAARAYKDINLLAFKLLRPHGILVTFSCSGGVDSALFQKIVAGSALDAGVEAQIVEYLSQDADHPVSLHFPEGAYLKGLVCLKK
ncbi:MAG: class I SAM-dependent methyltransferase [Anaerolineales bacterium]|nr:class I SAM-dependent methyltransferase [Anaerolineales bacterium]NUQ84711.1 class I SAM-dependent methyltransferase [Anaerolineales bacterium]